MATVRPHSPASVILGIFLIKSQVHHPKKKACESNTIKHLPAGHGAHVCNPSTWDKEAGRLGVQRSFLAA